MIEWWNKINNFPKSSMNAPAGIWTRDLSHLSPPLYQMSYQGMVIEMKKMHVKFAIAGL